MVSKVVLTLSAMLAVTAAVVPVGGWGANAGAPNAAANPLIPSWIASAPWYPQWRPCVTIGSSCLDCNTRLVCTKIGGLQRACTDFTLPHCNLGECSATPSVECAVPAVPASTVA